MEIAHLLTCQRTQMDYWKRVREALEEMVLSAASSKEVLEMAELGMDMGDSIAHPYILGMSPIVTTQPHRVAERYITEQVLWPHLLRSDITVVTHYAGVMEENIERRGEYHPVPEWWNIAIGQWRKEHTFEREMELYSRVLQGWLKLRNTYAKMCTQVPLVNAEEAPTPVNRNKDRRIRKDWYDSIPSHDALLNDAHELYYKE